MRDSPLSDGHGNSTASIGPARLRAARKSTLPFAHGMFAQDAALSGPACLVLVKPANSASYSARRPFALPLPSTFDHALPRDPSSFPLCA